MHSLLGVTTINLVNGWNTVWTSISSALGPLSTLLTAIGAGLVAVSIVGYIWERRRGTGNHSKLLWTLLIGAILAGPTFLIPMFLHIADFVANAIAHLLTKGGA
jgi:uncharacterized membrane-anchored protein